MTSCTEDSLNSDLTDGKALETLIIASVTTVKRGNKKSGREEVSKLVKNTLSSEICKDLFNETLDSLNEKQFIKCNIISNPECLTLPKDSELHHCSIQSTQKDSSAHEHLNPCPILDSETKRKSFTFKEELETFKVQVTREIKNPILKEISILKKTITTQSNFDVLSGKAQTEQFYQEQLRFMNNELRNKDNLIISLLHHLSKQAECIKFLNNRFSNSAIDKNENNDKFNHKNSYANENSNNNNNNNNNDNNNNNKNNINNNNNNNNNKYNINPNFISTISNQINEFNSNSNHHNHDSSNISNNNSNHNNTSSCNFKNCYTSNHNSNIPDNDCNNINSDNNFNNVSKKNKDNNNKEQNSNSPNKHKRNTNSRVSHKTKKPKDRFHSNNYSDNNDSDIDHIDTIDIKRHLNESKAHLNKSGTIELTKNACEFLSQQD